MYLEGMKLAMTRIAEYVQGYDFNRFRMDYNVSFELFYTVNSLHPENLLIFSKNN